MDQIIKPFLKMKTIYFFALSIYMIVSIPLAQAKVISYNVIGDFYEPMTQAPTMSYDTIFNGSFDWDGTTVSNLHGTMNSSMYVIDNVNPPVKYTSYPLMHLDYQLAQSVDGNMVTASVFLENSTDVFYGGGYKTGDEIKLGGKKWDQDLGKRVTDSMPANDNAYFTFSFDKTNMAGIVNSIIYADCTEGGMMGQTCMTGLDMNGGGPGTMGAYPLSLTISAVPVPAAVWMFGSAIAGMIGLRRKFAVQV